MKKLLTELTQNRLLQLGLCLCVLFCIGVYISTQQNADVGDKVDKMSVGDTSAGGHWHNGEWHAESHTPHPPAQQKTGFIPPKTEQEKANYKRLEQLIQKRAAELPKPNQPPETQFQETMIELQAGRISWKAALQDIENADKRKEQHNETEN